MSSEIGNAGVVEGRWERGRGWSLVAAGKSMADEVEVVVRGVKGLVPGKAYVVGVAWVL